MGLMKKGLDLVLETVFPSNIYCMRCGSMIDSTMPYALCDKCVRQLHWITGRTCEKCGKALPDTYRGKFCYDCMQRSHYFYKGYSCLTYGLHERELILDYKYNGRSFMGRKLGDILFDRISCECLDIDVIIPVPIHARRKKERGYNQSELMAGRLSELSGIQADMKIIKRSVYTEPLRRMTPAERENALVRAFAVNEYRRKNIDGRRVLLIDDIYTTGSTADACSRKLLEAGADKIFLLTLASGGNRKPV